MKKVFGMTFGSLQRKLLALVMLVILITIASLSMVSYYQNQMLVNLVQETQAEQQQSISRTSEETMSLILEDSIVKTTILQAQNTDNEFSEMVHNVEMLRRMAVNLFKKKDEVQPAEFSPPDPANEGVVSAMVLYEEGVDYRNSEYLPVVANMKDAMIAMDTNSEQINGCYIGLSDGTHYGIDSSSKDKFDENGVQIPFPVRERPWYVGAVEKRGVSFTGIEKDAFSDELNITCSTPIIVNNEIIGVVGLDIVLESMDKLINSKSANGSFVFIINDKGQVILAPENNGLFKAETSDKAEDLRNSSNPVLAEFVSTALERTTELTLVTLNDKDYYMVGSPMETVGWAVVSVIDKEIIDQPEKVMLSEYDAINQKAAEEFEEGRLKTVNSGIIAVLIISLIAFFASLASSRQIVKPISVMTKNIKRSNMSGKLFEMQDDYRTNDEIEVLAEAFTDLSKQTKKYIADITEITKEKERVNIELQMANRIQQSMIPHVFPPFPDRKEFDIYAKMDPARLVGGDFYDFYMVDSDHICLCMADVSGKGVPGALFMMISKVILKNFATIGMKPSEVLAKTNESICSSNQEEMFVTVWLGILEISTGKIIASNAGHEYPAVMSNGRFELLKDKHGFVIGGMEGIKYTDYEIQLKPGDKLFVYTDGVPEATDENNQMFGTERMIDALNKDNSASPEQILENVSTAMKEFVKEAEQFDDITMLCFEYHGKDTEQSAC